jgi:geranylgeranylglycerol-phosphate geranylgeranyltransferase
VIVETTNPSDERRMSPPNSASSFGLAPFLTLIRIPNCLMIGLAVLVAETIGLGGLPSPMEAVFGFLTAFLLLAGTMVFNDIQDAQVDQVNSPERPIPSGKVTIRQAYGLSIIFSALALISSLVLGILTFLTALVALALMAYYNMRGKKTGLLGNAVVSFNVALPFFFGGLAVNNLRPLLFIFFLLAFLANTAREVAKGIADVAGDSSRGIMTIAVTQGPKRAAELAAAFFVAAVLLSFLAPVFDQRVSLFYYPVVVIADLGFLYSSYRLVRDPTPTSVRKVKSQVLVWMLLGLVGFFMGGIPAL